MEAASLPWRPIGELFVARGVITQDQLEEALAEQAASGKRLGEILVDRQLVSSPELTQTLMEQLGRQVAKEDGFGSGLWSEIQRRTARGDRSSVLALVEDDEPASAGPALRDSFAARAAKAVPEPPPTARGAGRLVQCRCRSQACHARRGSTGLAGAASSACQRLR